MEHKSPKPPTCPTCKPKIPVAIVDRKFYKWNHYVCDKCGGVTVARHDTEGVTPFSIRCRAKDEWHENAHVMVCMGEASSQFFNVSQDDNQKPHVVFYRPERKQAMEEIAKESGPNAKVNAAWLLDHYNKGGSLMREVNPNESNPPTTGVQ